MTAAHIPSPNLPVLLFYHHTKVYQYPNRLSLPSYPPADDRKPFYVFQYPLHEFLILIRKEHNHLIGKQSRIFEEQRFRLQLGCPVDRRKLFRQFLPGKSQILRSIVVAPYANNVFVHLFS